MKKITLTVSKMSVMTLLLFLTITPASSGVLQENDPRAVGPAWAGATYGIDYCGYLNVGGDARARAVAVDSLGCAYVAGVTYFPGTAWGRPNAGFVVKLSADGRDVVYRRTISGVSITAIAVDALGRATIAGSAWEDSGLQPVVGPDLTYNGGTSDAFVARLDASGSEFEYAGYIGGSSADSGRCLALDAAGNAYVAGGTYSTEATFPVKVGPILVSDLSAMDGFVAKVKADGTGLDYCGFISGWHTSVAAIAIDARGCAYVCGDTTGGLPVKTGPCLVYSGEDSDSFVAKLYPDGSGFDYCGYIGTVAGDWEDACAITVDELGRAFVTGWVPPYSDDFPVNFGPDLTWNGRDDAWVARVSEEGADLEFCGYIGGNGEDSGNGIALDAEGNVVVCGSTQSDQATFPVTGGPDLTANGKGDAFVAWVRYDGDYLSRCTFLGGGGVDEALAVATDPHGNVYVVGDTTSGSDSFPVRRGPGLAFTPDARNVREAFVARLGPIFQLTFRAGRGGSLSGELSQQVIMGGSSAPVTAVAETGYRFVNWTGSDGFASTANPLTVEDVTAGLAVTAHFARLQYRVEFRAGPGGTLSGSASQLVYFGLNTAPVTALPDPGYRFAGWTGGGGFASTANPITIVGVTADLALTAGFANLPPSVRILQPVAGETVHGPVEIRASADDDSEVERVDFYLDGAELTHGGKPPAAGRSAPGRGAAPGLYTLTWDSRGTGNGLHVLRAVALDRGGLSASHELTVSVANLLLQLSGARKQQRAWFLRRDYAELNATAVNPAGLAVSRYRLLRRDPGGDFVAVAEKPAGSELVFLDNSLPRSGAVTYRIEARDSADGILAQSNDVVL